MENNTIQSLPDLQAFVQQEKRLPGIPSAEEVTKQGGHNMTELQIKLLEKIEELTLYTLEQEERLRQKDQEVELLNGEIEVLKRKDSQTKLRLVAIEERLRDRR